MVAGEKPIVDPTDCYTLYQSPTAKRMQLFRPRRATRDDMTRFHSDEYVEFLEKVTPETAEAMTGGGVRCE